MIQADHNATLVQIDPMMDPSTGNPSGPPRWQGQMWAHVETDSREVVSGSQRLLVIESAIRLPANMPVWPVQEDILTWRMLRTNENVQATVSDVNDRFWLLGFVQINARLTVQNTGLYSDAEIIPICPP